MADNSMTEFGTTTDITALQADIKQLRADFSRIAGTVRDLANSGVAEVEKNVSASADRVWTEAKRHAQTVSHEIEERPLASAFTAFAAGIVIAMFLTGRR